LTIHPIPPTVTSLDLSNNEFDKKTRTELAQIFAASTVTSASLNLSEMIATQLKQLMLSLSLHTRTILIDDKPCQ
jgi:hypothetical protein